jgi:hypothetical protein
MKPSILISALIACALSAPIASAQGKPVPAKPAMNMDMEKHMGEMQDKMKAMQAQMDTIRTVTDPEVRQRLMQEHMQSMQENMKTMHAMGGPMMQGGGQQGGMKMGGKAGGMAGGDMMKHHEMMEKRMDMMQMMMEQMMQHDQMIHSMPAK